MRQKSYSTTKRTGPCFLIPWSIVPIILFTACRNIEAEAPPLFTLVENSGVDFSNNVKDSREDNSFLFRNFYNGGGVAVGDINNDGLPDVFLTSNQGENKLYLNKDSLKFEDISSVAGLKQDGMWSTGATMVDLNADGFLDIYVCNSGHIGDGNRRNKLYINNRDLTFSESAAAFKLDISGYCTQASFFDYDLDGDLDCFIINNSPIPFSSLNYASMRDVDIAHWKVDEKLKGGGNHLYRNDDNVFVEVTAKAGLHTGLISFGLGVSVGDVDNDGYPDIYVGNDFIEKDYLYMNKGNGTFEDELEQRIQQISMSSMSTDLSDINNDGHPEIFTTDMIPDDDFRLKTTGTFDNVDLFLSKQKAGLYNQFVRNCLQLNRGNGHFSEIGNYAGVYGTDWSWGSVFLDMDNDGFSDIFVCNGIAKDVGDLDFLDFFSGEVYRKMLATGERADMEELLRHIPATPIVNRIFKNRGDLQFEDVGKSWGFTQTSFSNSVAYTDLDRDGDLDLVVNNENSPAFIYRNNARQQAANNYISVQLKSQKKNRYALGSKIKVYHSGQIFYRELYPVRGFQSSMDPVQVIGLGTVTKVDSLVIVWPDRTFTKMISPELNRLHVIQQPTNPSAPRYVQSMDSPAYFKEVSTSFDKHVEDEFVDFYYERNLPQANSRKGPLAATGDVNGDNLKDIYIGGAKDQAGQLYVQTPDGKFVNKKQAVFEQYKDFEDVAVLFFDSDRDGDLDLFVGAGGNHVRPGGREIQHRLYKNDGAGNFVIDVAAFPNNNMNIATAVSNDYDGDGDLDVFVGGGSVPYNYGVTPQSYLYRNDGKGIFSDVTNELNAALATVGMVSAALWVDVVGDEKKELVVTGEWMATKIFMYSRNKFTEVHNTGLEKLHGLWQTIAAADLNGDGKQDLVLGNIGENFYLRPGQASPVKLWITDFDGNGSVDQFLTRSIHSRDMPVFLKREITEQFPFLKKGNLKHADYARKSIHDLFDDETLKRSTVKKFNYCSSIIAINNGKGGFLINQLPGPIQLSSVNAICPADVDEDGQIDLILGGNLFSFLPQFGRLDASYGDILLNQGNAHFQIPTSTRSGLNLTGEVKNITSIELNGRTHLLITQNDRHPVLHRLNK